MSTDNRTSPFPGMDPYLEADWPEVHARLIVYGCDQLNPQLASDLRTRVEATVSIVDETAARRVGPDLHVVEDPTKNFGDGGVAVMEATATATTPKVISLDERLDRHLEIIDRDSRVITAIEFISPGNKIGLRDRNLYERKQIEYRRAGINLVEIDLVRQGEYNLSLPQRMLMPEDLTGYIACVWRVQSPRHYDIYPMSIQEPLANLAIPLRPGEPDVVLQLQPLIDAAYSAGRYGGLNYAADPPVPFEAEQLAWIRSHLQSVGRRNRPAEA